MTRWVDDPSGPKSTWVWTLIYGSIPFVGWLIWLVIFWPGMMTVDSVWQWHQLEDGALDDWHPFAYTVAIGLMRGVVDHPALPLGIFMVGGALVIGRFAVWTAIRGRSKGQVLASMALILVLPASSLIPVVLWKDVVFGFSILALTLIIWRVEDTGGNWLDRWQNLMTLGVSSLIVWLTRHNGWPVVVGLMVVLMVAHRDKWRRVVPTALSVAVVASLVTGPIAGMLDVRPSGQPGAILGHRVAMHLAAGTPFAESEIAFLNTIKPLEEGWPYWCRSVVPFLYGPDGVNEGALAAEADRLLPLVVDLTLRHPRAELRHLGCSTRLLWQPSDIPGATFFLGLTFVDGSINYIDNIRPDTPVEATSFPGAVMGVYEVVEWLPDWLIRPAIPMYLLISALGFAAFRRRARRVLLLGVPAGLNTLVLVPFTISQDVRFQFGVIIVAVVLVPALVTVAPAEEPTERLLEW
jgi:hypothetical protein